MKFTELFTKPAKSARDAERIAIAERVSTLKGCEAMIDEITSQHAALDERSPGARLLRRKLEELNRIKRGYEVESDRERVNALIITERNQANRDLKQAERQVQDAGKKLADAMKKQEGRLAIVQALKQELGDLEKHADEAVRAAEANLRKMISEGSSTAAVEQEASDALKNAKESRDKCGESIRFRLEAHQAELSQLNHLVEEAEIRVAEAAQEADYWRGQIARINLDEAAQRMVDVYLSVLAIPSVPKKSSRLTLPRCDIDGVKFISKERAVWGNALCSDVGGLRGQVLSLMATWQLPPDLGLLCEVVTSAAPEEEDLDA